MEFLYIAHGPAPDHTSSYGVAPSLLSMYYASALLLSPISVSQLYCDVQEDKNLG